MKRRRIKLIWGASKVIRGHWYLGLFGVYERVDGERESGLAISVRGGLLWSGAMAVVLYFAGALALASFWQRNPYSLLNYEDALLYPVRRAVVAEKKGQAFIAEGTELCKAGKWSDGARLLARGLNQAPRDLNARLMLARFYAAANQRENAVTLLRAGFAADFPGRGYTESTFEIAEQAEDFELIVSIADRYLPKLTRDSAPRDRRWLGAKKFAALLAAKQLEAALAFAESEDPGEMASEHRVLALVELGRPVDALAYMATWAALPGADPKQVLRLKVRALREAGRPDEMGQAIDALRVLTPGDARTAVYGVVQWAMAGKDARARVAFDDFIFRFGGTAANISMMAEPLGEVGQVQLVERCVAAAQERGYPVQGLRIILVQALAQSSAWTAAAEELARLQVMPNSKGAEVEKIWRDWMQVVIEAARTPTDKTQAALVDFLRGRPWSVRILRRTTEWLRRAGRNDTALSVVAIGQGAYPASAWFKAQQEELARAAAKSASTAPSSPVVAGPVTPEVPRATGERFFFEELDRALKAKEWGQAERAMRAVRNSLPRPEWLDSRDGDLRLAEVRIKQGTGDRAAMLTSAGLYLNGDAERARRMTELAQELFMAGQRTAAIDLVERVLRKTPTFAAAEKLLAEWKPKPPVAPKEE